MNKNRIERILVLAKTYPSPSANYNETTCVAGISESGEMRRIYPVPFRMLEDAQQFKKWQWVSARIEKSPNDHRPESHKIYVDTIEQEETLDTKQDWLLRREWISKIPDTQDAKTSLYLVKPSSISELEIVKDPNPDWTEEEKDKLTRDQNQLSLFGKSGTSPPEVILTKIPYKFYYHYTLETAEGQKSYKHKIVDWEAGALYLNCKKGYGDNWERPFRKKLEQELPSKDLMLLLGNIHRFQHQWLIISLIYPPIIKQPSLF